LPPMRTWIVTIYEPLPFDAPETRPQRCGMLAKALIRRGHKVELWTSTFDHVKHTHYFRKSGRQDISDNFSIQYLDGCGYRNDHSLKRIFHNRQTARIFLEVALERSSPPDIIFAPVPSLELAEAAAHYAKIKSCPIVVDIRDLWPDVYFTMFPEFMRSFVKPFFYSEISRARRILRGANAITAISESYLKWGLDYAERSPHDSDKVFPLGFVNAINFKQNDIDRYSGVIRKKYDIGVNKFIVTYVGTFSGFTDVPCILEAAHCFLDDDRVHFLIVGSGEKANKYFSIGEKLRNVTMTGWVDFREVCSLLRITDVGLVAYSDIATMSLPNKPFEYMASGIPLLSSLKGELECITLNNNIGRMYKSGDVSSLVSEIKWFLENRDKAKVMGRKALSLFKREFLGEVIYSKLSIHMERIARSHHEQ